MLYSVDAAKVQVREFWWETKLFFWVGIIVKLFRIRLRGSTDDLAVDSLHGLEVDPATIPPDIQQRFAPVFAELQSQGFASPIWHYQENILQATRNTIATLLHESGRSFARVQYRVNFIRTPARAKFFTTYISPTISGHIVTGNGKYDMAWPTNQNVIRYRNASNSEAWLKHQQRLTAAVQRIPADQLRQAAEKYHITLRDFHLSRGVFSPLTEGDQAMLNSNPAAPVSPDASPIGTAPPDLLEAATLDELNRLQKSKANWRFSLALLAVSAVFFVMQSRRETGEQDWEFISMVVGILFVHELGHFIAMKIFGYRNVRMFFIPGFGAAVSGRHYNAPGWKKIIVSLMGPLPGILIGCVLMVLSPVLHLELLNKIGMLTILINGFNLIPILPLDGGWVAHAAIFARNPKADVIFRGIAATAMVLIAIKVPTLHILMYIGILGFLTLPSALRTAGIVSELRKIPGLGASPDSQTIPTETARIIYAKLRQRVKRGLNARSAAQNIVSVFESLNARPPGIGATIGLLTLHAGGFAVAAFALLVAFIIHNGGLPGRRRTLEMYTIHPSELIVPLSSEHGARNTVIAQFKTVEESRSAYQKVTGPGEAELFGPTVLVTFAPANSSQQREFYTRLKTAAKDVFVESPSFRASVRMEFSANGNASAQQAIEDAQLYLPYAHWRLIPPWADEKDWPATQRAEQTTYRQIVHALQALANYDDPRFQPLNEKYAEAMKSGDTIEVERLDGERKKMMDEIEAKRLASVKATWGHVDFIDHFQAIATSTDYKSQLGRYRSEIAPLLGQWPMDKSDDSLAARGFAFQSNDAPCNLNCEFHHMDTGLVALTQWLFANGVTEIQYRLSSYPVRKKELDEDAVDGPD